MFLTVECNIFYWIVANTPRSRPSILHSPSSQRLLFLTFQIYITQNVHEDEDTSEKAFRSDNKEMSFCHQSHISLQS